MSRYLSRRNPVDYERLPVGHMFADWLYGLVCLDSAGNYRYSVAAGQRLRGKITAWNAAAKRQYRDSMDLHYTAIETMCGYPRLAANHPAEMRNLFSEAT